jgi:RNA polymerase sigma-70 factor (ECF subfamily)
MTPAEQTRTAAPDHESARGLADLHATGPARDAAIERLHELLLRVARAELHRRSATGRIGGPELDDLSYQATADALVTIVGKLDTFRGESRFTTWACKFVIFEVSAKLGRHFWQRPHVAYEAEDWDRLPDRFGVEPDRQAHQRGLVQALRRAVDTRLTERQRALFVARVLHDVPLDALVAKFGGNRNAIYKSLFDARRKLREALVAEGYLDQGEVS